MTESNNHTLTDNQNEQALNSLRNEIESLKFQLKKKEDRIAALVPLYRQGLIWHNKNISGPLEAQLLSFPNSKRFDLMDAFAYIVELLEKGDRYFFPKSETQNPVEQKELKKVMADDYADLSYIENMADIAGDNMMKAGRWRQI